MMTEINWRKSTPSWGKELAEHPDTSTYALSALAAHDDLAVRTAVADQKNMSCETMMILAKDTSVDLKYAIAENHNIHADVLTMLAEDDSPFVAHRAQQTLERIRTYILVAFPVIKAEPLSA